MYRSNAGNFSVGCERRPPTEGPSSLWMHEYVPQTGHSKRKVWRLSKGEGGGLAEGVESVFWLVLPGQHTELCAVEAGLRAVGGRRSEVQCLCCSPLKAPILC